MTDITIEEDELFALNRELKKYNKELKQLRAEKEIWLKIVNYDQQRYQRMWDKFKGTGSSYIFPKEDRDHLKNLEELASKK